MTRSPRAFIWFNRLLLAAATVIMTMVAVRTLSDPIGAARPVGIVLSSPTAITVARVGFGGLPRRWAMNAGASTPRPLRHFGHSSAQRRPNLEPEHSATFGSTAQRTAL